MSKRLKALALLIAASYCQLVLPAEPPPPWTSLDFSSPQATISSCQELLTALRANGAQTIEHNIYQFLQSNRELLRRFHFCADYSAVARERLDETAIESLLYIIEILDRTPPLNLASIPDYAQVTADRLNSWRIPGSKIAIVRKDSGDREGEWLISAHTIGKLQTYYQQVRHLPYRSDALFGNIGPLGGIHDYYIIAPAGPLLWDITANQLPPWALRRYAGQPLWKWLLMLSVCGLAAALWWQIYQFALSRQDRLHGHTSLTFWPPLAGIVLCIIVEWFIDESVGIVGTLAYGTEVLLLTLAWGFVGWLVVSLGNRLAAHIPQTKEEENPDTGLATILVRTCFAMLAVWMVLLGIEDLGISLIPLIAGLGVGGLAIALAIRPTLENLIAGLLIFADKPVQVGDRCRYGDKIGDVEVIGLRSTRIRSLDGTQLSIPNALFSQLELENISRRERTLFAPVLGLRYETRAEQLEALIASLSNMLVAHPNVLSDDLRVRFLGFGDYALEIEIYAYINSGNRERFMAIQQALNLRIMALVSEAGTDFAFPSQTTYLSRDPSLG